MLWINYVFTWLNPVGIFLAIRTRKRIVDPIINVSYSAISLWMLCVSVVAMSFAFTRIAITTINAQYLKAFLFIMITALPLVNSVMQSFEWD